MGEPGELRGTILIVDDEESIRNVVAFKLEADGYDCEVAVDGKEALRKAFMKDFDLVLMDIKMPGMSGTQALPALLIDHPDTSVVMMTGVVDVATAVECMKLGAYDYVTKPFDLDDLNMRIERALERRRLIQENKEYLLEMGQKVKVQAEQIHQYYMEAIEAFFHEQLAREELEVLRTSVQEYAGKLLKSLGNVTPTSVTG